LGCGAVDKGANSPNLFGDLKSSENARSPFSDGTPDSLVQRQFLRAHHQWWQPSGTSFSEANNPSSSKYSGRMLDPNRLFVWTWDARPYPAFPAQINVWADGANHETGHWLTGRLGATASDELLAAMAADYGVSFANISAAKPLLPGARISNVSSLRQAVEPVLEATGLIMRDGEAGLSLIHPTQTTDMSVAWMFWRQQQGQKPDDRAPTMMKPLANSL
jgi:Gene Transfer Agent (GTA)-like protein